MRIPESAEHSKATCTTSSPTELVGSNLTFGIPSKPAPLHPAIQAGGCQPFPVPRGVGGKYFVAAKTKNTSAIEVAHCEGYFEERSHEECWKIPGVGMDEGENNYSEKSS